MRVSAKQRERGETLRDGTALCCSKENRHSTKSEDEFLNFGGNLLEFKLSYSFNNNKNNAQSNTPKCTTQGRV